MTRIAVIDLTVDRLYIEDVDDEKLRTYYDGKIDKYVAENYGSEVNFSVIKRIEYTPVEGAPFCLEPETLI